MNPDDTLYQIAVWLIPLVIAIVFHEVAHGYVARLFGDHTAERTGRLTLNPIRHVDPVGTVVVPMVLALAHAPIFGWAKPVPVVAARMRNPAPRHGAGRARRAGEQSGAGDDHRARARRRRGMERRRIAAPPAWPASSSTIWSTSC